jgi:hypothetical protein
LLGVGPRLHGNFRKPRFLFRREMDFHGRSVTGKSASGVRRQQEPCGDRRPRRSGGPEVSGRSPFGEGMPLTSNAWERILAAH